MNESTAEEPGNGTDPAAGEDHGPPPTPFDHPLFLPVLLAAFSVWFGYDAYLNDDPEMADHLAFNRFGVRVVGYLTLIIGYQGWRELKGRPATPWIVPFGLAAMTLWLGYDGWVSQDSLNLEYQPFNRHAATCLGIATAAFGASTWLRQNERPEPFFAMPLVLAAFALWFGSRLSGEENLLVAYVSACGGLGALSLWLLLRKFRERRARH